jgi:hypothetical protein
MMRVVEKTMVNFLGECKMLLISIGMLIAIVGFVFGLTWLTIKICQEW